jgi:hypothetical protein
MRRCIAKKRSEALVAGLLMLLTSAAHADPIQPSYTVTDLGSGNLNYSTYGIVIAPNGQTPYTFWLPSARTSTSTGDLANLPVPETAPPTYGGPFPRNGSTAIDATLYPNGIATAIDELEQTSYPQRSQTYIPYFVQRNPDGSWGQPVVLGQGWTNFGAFTSGGPGVSIDGLNKAGDILVTRQPSQGEMGFTTSTLYNIYTNTSTDLSTLPALVNNGFSFPKALSMDNDGRILLYAEHQTATGSSSDDLLLLTPAGVSTDPINTPEPGSTAVVAMAMAAFAVHRARRRG